ncbi:hypothetical protein FRACYDRAFT_254487 [Fragilariopsis cylindrus CCMP1102]|uniref:Uncharacterized protein n=1 Tax=Fragilariopsis cylindrus CCMP1102 TaxID=635003 RepID=A0A1E7EKM2_9STRA|nr:hypothetical protein FRACYDRAFT_254487 [Fragilariopsis cylindrus CCMP1102]|eukprot:OEU06470.1 hypothetical protein FRACYDRAFT_254487 [Fragilariopsis cylindrus CCMP1102]
MELQSEWTIGITDTKPNSWKKLEPIWEDDIIGGCFFVATTYVSRCNVMIKLCEAAIKKRRGRRDYGIHEHMEIKNETVIKHKEVLSIKPTIAKNLMNYYFGNAEAKPEKSDLEDLQSMPAYRLPKEEQVDYYLPNLSKAFWDIMSFFLYLSRDDDTTSSSLANGTFMQDLMFCPNKIKLNEFLQVAEKSWTPRDRNEDPDISFIEKYNH